MDDKVNITKFIPHKDLQSNWSFFSVNFRGKEYVFGIKFAIKKTYTVHNKDGSPIIVPKTGEPQINFDSQPIIQSFTAEEYNKLIIGDKDENGV